MLENVFSRISPVRKEFNEILSHCEQRQLQRQYAKRERILSIKRAFGSHERGSEKLISSMKNYESKLGALLFVACLRRVQG